MFILPIISPTVKKPRTSAAVTPASAISLALALRTRFRMFCGERGLDEGLRVALRRCWK